MVKSAIGPKELIKERFVTQLYSLTVRPLSQSIIFLLLAVCNTLNDVSVRYVGRGPQILHMCLLSGAANSTLCREGSPNFAHVFVVWGQQTVRFPLCKCSGLQYLDKQHNHQEKDFN